MDSPDTLHPEKIPDSTDIAGQTQGSPPLDDEKTFYGRVIQNAATPLFVINASHTVLFWNNALAQLTGKSSFQMKGTRQHWTPFYPAKRPTLADLVIDRSSESIHESYAGVKASPFAPGAFQSEGWFEAIGGKRRYLLFEAAPIVNSKNEIVAAVQTIEDITDRKLAQDSMDNQNRFLQEILEAIPNPVFYKDIGHAFLGCNKAFSAFFGATVQEVLGKTLADIIAPEHARASIAKDREIIASRVSMTYETPMVRCDGQIRTVLVTKAPFSGADGSLAGIVGTFVDVTEKRLLDEQVTRAKREWEETLDSLKDFVILTDSGHHVRRCNRFLCDMTGTSFSEVIGRDWRELLAETGFRFIDFNGRQGELIKTKSHRHYDLNIYPMTEPGNGQITGYVVSLHDTTEIRTMTEELKRTARELSEAQQAVYQQEKLASIGQLAAGVAHEINNPMGFISSNLATLGKYLDKIAGFETAMAEAVQERGDTALMAALTELRRKMKIDFILNDIRGLLDESRDGAQRVRRIVQDLKSFSHLDEAECKPFSINECLQSTLNMARNEIKYVAEVEQDYDPDLPLLECYPQQLNQVFMNLLVNAAHAMEGHGTIRIATRREHDEIIVRVSDTGKGIAPENLTRIFEPFFTTKEVGKGTGLGLSISYDIVKKHGGTMTVESTVGAGTTFTIRLPIKHACE